MVYLHGALAFCLMLWVIVVFGDYSVHGDYGVHDHGGCMCGV